MKLKIRIANLPILVVLILDILTYVSAEMYAGITPYLPYINLVFCGYVLVNSWKRKVKARKILLLLIATAYIFIDSILLNNSLGAVATFLAIFCYCDYFRNVDFDDSTEDIIAVAGIVYILFFATFAKKYADNFYATKTGDNPNVIAFMISVFLYYITAYLCRNKRRHIAIGKVTLDLTRIEIVTLWLISFSGALQLKSRTEMVAILAFGFANLFLMGKRGTIADRKTSMKKMMAVVSLVVIGGCVFPWLYVLLSRNESISYFAYELTGKFMFTGREVIWERFLTVLKNEPAVAFFGAGTHSEFLFGQGFSMHSSYMGIVLNFGFLGVLLFLVYTLNQVKEIYKAPITRYQQELLFGYVSILLISYTEVVLQTVNSVVFCSMLIGLAGNKYLLQKRKGKETDGIQG